MIAKKLTLICLAARGALRELGRERNAVHEAHQQACADGLAFQRQHYTEAGERRRRGLDWTSAEMRHAAKADRATSGMEIARRYRDLTGPMVGDSTPLESTGKSGPNSG